MNDDRQVLGPLSVSILKELAAGSSAPVCWPTFSEYHGGGVILSPTTSDSNVRFHCATTDLLCQVREQLRAGREVIIYAGAIVAAQSANAPVVGRERSERTRQQEVRHG